MDMEDVFTKLKRGLYVGAGTFMSSYVGNQVEEFTGGSGAVVAMSQVGVGSVMAIGTDAVIGNLDREISRENELVQMGEFAGYGVIGAGAAEFAENVRTDGQTGAEADRIVSVNASGAQQPSGANTGQAEAQTFSLDTA